MADHANGTTRCPTEGGFGNGHRAFDCTVNSWPAEVLFQRYEACGFLYAAKLARLRPYWPLILSNWKKSMTAVAGRPLHEVVVFERPGSRAWASVGFWATTNRTAHTQHLVSVGRPEASRAVLLSGQSALHNHGATACQNWFRAENRFPARVFGTCEHALGTERATVASRGYVALPRHAAEHRPTAVCVHKCADRDGEAIHAIAERLCGQVPAAADEWLTGDVELRALDARYREVGLRRYRHVFVAEAVGSGQPVGLGVAYRGPLGLNLSFLENRCEVWVASGLDRVRHTNTIDAIVHAATATYTDFELPVILVACDGLAAEHLIQRGADAIQSYCRAAWLRDGFQAWYHHVDSFYQRLDCASRRRDAMLCQGHAR